MYYLNGLKDRKTSVSIPKKTHSRQMNFQDEKEKGKKSEPEKSSRRRFFGQTKKMWTKERLAYHSNSDKESGRRGYVVVNFTNFL